MDNKKSLYRIYRPKNLDQVAGHEGIKEILKSEIESNNYPHALLFSGQRGTGKTSIAKIFAKIVNCTNLQKYNPCDECVSCKEFNNNAHSDIFEMDAASNNGVDEIRNIKANVSTLPSISKYKVYIIDEVHMLTNSAFNALLKTLEEPPTHVIFILATTEFSKIPQTIISRCQLFNFKRISKSALENKVEEVCNSEGSEIDSEALEEIYYMSDGSLRDALNYLEQSLTISTGKVTTDELKKIFYIATKKEKVEVLKNIFDGKANEIINYFENSNDQGIDFQATILGLLNILKEIVSVKMTGNFNYLKILDQDEFNYFESVQIEKIFSLADNISEAYTKTKNSNVSYQYILINILKTIKGFTTTPISVVVKNDLNENNKIENVQPYISNFNQIKKVEEPKVEEPKVEEQNLRTETLQEENNNIQNVVADENKMETVTRSQSTNEKNISDENRINNILDISNEEEKLLKLQMYLMVENMTGSSSEIEFSDNQILNSLLNVDKDLRKTYDEKIQNLVFSNKNNLEELKKYICFYNGKVSAANDQSLILIVEDSGIAQWINYKLQNEIFRNDLFSILEANVAIICIDKKRWKQIKEEYMFRKQSGILNNVYEPIDLGNFYESLNEVESENEYLKRAREILDIEIKVVD
ncbi:DNA polymerase III subunit gamma/tau [Spiroplasma chinense]|uniref:DNA polymerase III subunit gamma/tau n=1 Tax=Spiroplasma chinense TaxID=216932 RepID=A0A5B9Y354_9MOLU|nr:DNA polymerase III subunit gamma/tau [Spiroplasma chinense]QEH61205.1 DNA polymerase III subunit gamma/tau [Spiroplasma chinense]